MTIPSDIPEHIYEWAGIFIDEHRHIEDNRELVARAYMMAGQGAGRHSGLTFAQASALKFIQRFQAQHGTSPSYSEIAEGVGLSSKSGAHRIVHQLVERGAVHFLPGRARSIAVAGRA